MDGMNFTRKGYSLLTTYYLLLPLCPSIKSLRMAEQKEPVILVTNDDGINAPGIKNLVEAVKGLGKIVVVAPDKPQSGMGHAITIGQPLRLSKVKFFDDRSEERRV